MLTAEVIEQLRELKKLTDEGLITEQEFTAKKAQLLDLPPMNAMPPVQATPIATAVVAAPGAAALPAAKPRASKAPDKPIGTGVSLTVADCGTRGVMVTGDTLRAKAQLKAMGGRWDAKLTAWLFHGMTVAQLVEDLQARGINASEDAADGIDPAERRQAELNAEKQAALDHGATANACAKLTVARHKKAVLVTGDTSKVKDMLRALDGKWIPSLGGYCHAGSRTTELLAALRADPTNEVTDATADAAATPAKPAKRQRGVLDECDDEFDDCF
jgi:protein tyrosine phosphatase (PTP) superfamily phosphohydrolase (DUF442 family)